MNPRIKLFLGIVGSVIFAAITPVLSANFVGWIYGIMILGKGGASAEFIFGWVAGLWIAPFVLVLGVGLSFYHYRNEYKIAQQVAGGDAAR